MCYQNVQIVPASSTDTWLLLCVGLLGVLLFFSLFPCRVVVFYVGLVGALLCSPFCSSTYFSSVVSVCCSFVVLVCWFLLCFGLLHALLLFCLFPIVATYPSARGRREAHGCVFQGKRVKSPPTFIRGKCQKNRNMWFTNFNRERFGSYFYARERY